MSGLFSVSYCIHCWGNNIGSIHLSCRKTYDRHLASCSFPFTRENRFFSADGFCPHPPSVSVTETLPITNSRPLDHMSYFVDEYLIDFADNEMDTSDFYRRYMAGFVVSKRETLLTHCGSSYTRSFNMSSYGSLDTQDLMCLMLGFTPIVESTPLFTDTTARQSLIAESPQLQTCVQYAEVPGVLDHSQTTDCMYFILAEAYHLNSTVKYPYCNSFSFTDDYNFIVNRSIVSNITDISADFKVDGAIRGSSDIKIVIGPDSVSNPAGIFNDQLVGRQYSPLTEILGVTIYYNNEVFINVVYI